LLQTAKEGIVKKSYKFLIGLAIVAVLAVTYRAPVVDAAINAIKQLKIDLANGNVPIGSTSTTLSDGTVLIGSSSDVAAEQTVSGDVTISNAGVAAIATGVVVNADISASAAISHSKFANLTSTGILVGSSAGVATERIVTGDVTISNTGATTIGAGTVETAMLQSGLAPSHVVLYAGEVTWSGASTTLKSGIFGSYTSDILITSLNTAPSETGYIAAADLFKNNSAVFTLSTSNASNDAVISYTVHRAAP
jgi:hypothetical protein